MSKTECELLLLLNKVKQLNCKCKDLSENYQEQEFSFFKSLCLHFRREDSTMLDVKLLQFFLNEQYQKIKYSRYL